MLDQSALSLSSKICRNKDGLWAEVDDALVLMSIEGGNYYSLDTIGADIWQRLDIPLTVIDLCEGLSRDYDADIDTIQRDVLGLLAPLAREGLIEIIS